MFVLDTNVISEMRRPERANSNVRVWVSARPPGEFFLSVATILELELGARLMERKDARQAGIYRNWIDGFILPTFDGRILPVDRAVALRCAALHVPNKRSDRDAFIAATALIHGMTVVTRNVRDFEGTGVSLINPWEIAA